MSDYRREPETKDDAIVRVIGFRRENHNNQIIRFDPNQLANWQTLLNSPYASSAFIPALPLGTMAILPNEVILAIVNELDIESCFNLRKVSRMGREMVGNTLEFGRIVTHAPACLQAMLQTGVARWYTFRDLDHIMSLRDCELCHKLAAYVYLPTLTKACDRCITLCNRFATMKLAFFAEGACLPEKASSTMRQIREHMPIVKTIPGKYHHWKTLGNRSFDMVCFHQTFKVMVATGAADSLKLDCDTLRAREDFIARRMVTAPLPYYNKDTQEVETPLICKGCAITRHSERKRQHTEKGYLGCVWYYTGDHDKSGLLEHFGRCSEAQKLWALSKDGTVSTEPYENDFIRGGGVRARPHGEDPPMKYWPFL